MPIEARVVRLQRVKASHRGISRHTTLVELEAGAVNQPFLDEIGSLVKLEYLDRMRRVGPRWKLRLRANFEVQGQ